MLRFGAVVRVGCVCLGGPTVAFAQQPGQGPPMPIAVDLAKVPAGSWADYAMTMGQLPPMKMRIALVDQERDRQHHRDLRGRGHDGGGGEDGDADGAGAGARSRSPRRW